jgi:hypothetical protein
MTNLGQSIVKGEKVEKVSEIRLSKKFGQDNVKIESGFGLDTDASEGLDGSIKIDGRIYKCQIKPYKTSFIEDGKLVVLTSSSVSDYKVDFMIFSNAQNTLVIKTQNTELGINSKFYIDLLGGDQPALTPEVAAALPELSDGPHFAYALQWIIFGGLVVYGRFLIRREVLTREKL